MTCQEKSGPHSRKSRQHSAGSGPELGYTTTTSGYSITVRAVAIPFHFIILAVLNSTSLQRCANVPVTTLPISSITAIGVCGTMSSSASWRACICTNKEDLEPPLPMPDIRKKLFAKSPDALAAVQAPGGNDSFHTRIDGGQFTISDLTPAGKALYKEELDMFSQVTAMEKEKRDNVKTVRDWVIKTVHADFKTNCYFPNSTLGAWHDNLRRRCRRSDREDDAMARAAYYEAIEPPRKGPRDPKTWEVWIDRWERALAMLHKRGLPEEKNITFWLQHFFNAVNDYVPDWVIAFRVGHSEKITTSTLTFGEVGDPFRFELEFRETPSEDKSYVDVQATNVSRQRTETSRERGHARKRGRGDASQSCLACDSLRHSVEQCYYVFPERAPRGFRLRENVKARVDTMIQRDDDLCIRIDELMRTKRSRT